MSTSHHIGTAKPLRLADDVTSTALYDGPGNCYRYRLCRVWNPQKPLVMWLLMNPSVATETGDDRTVAKCQRYARTWGYGGMFIGNSFAYRCTDQMRLLEIDDPVGPHNDHHLLDMARHAKKIVLAYGTPHAKALQTRGPYIVQRMTQEGISLSALKLSKTGRPIHPLYLSESLTPLPLTVTQPGTRLQLKR